MDTARQSSEGKQFFFEKKNQKTFGSWLLPTVTTHRGRCGPYNSKSFLVLFCKKELLPSFPRLT